MVQISSAQDSDPVINVIEQDVPGVGSAASPSGGDGRDDALNSAALEAMLARRRREFDTARTRLRDQAIRDDAGASRRPGVRPVTDVPLRYTGTDHVPLDQPPERVCKRYLRAGNQYFLKEAPYQLAFEDLGPYLVTEHNRPDVVESMIDIAHVKSWERIRVSGHKVFRSEVWLQATLLGIEVSGYEPKAADLARLADARQARLNNRIEAGLKAEPTAVAGSRASTDERYASSPSPQARARAASNDASPAGPTRKESHAPPPVPESRNTANDEPDAPRRYVGELREHGGAPYQHNPARSDSYYVVFRDEAGVDHVVWGVDLERAVLESLAAIGQLVTLENLGKRLVTVKVPILDGDGAVVGEEEKDVHRNTWLVDVVQRERVASQATSRAETPSGDAAQPYADEHLQPVAERVPQRGHGAQRGDDERGLHLAVLTAAMREQGFSERSISRVQQHAVRMLDAFGKEDIPVPPPKVFDAKAPSGRGRRMRTAAERAPAREVERAPAEPSMPAP
ncbi:DNA primase [Paraburkholderia madseniana]|uniref:DNA primase n=1 Tax=Paraburkholderia madseniana TaxID=2599607 RepID=A0A6N6W3X5_9BURK|nr:LPD7 domain-containing protein [Paraburkholderia madseniana]KAE8755322.1 DNA primase [Paraburkholderia madseniana]